LFQFLRRELPWAHRLADRLILVCFPPYKISKQFSFRLRSNNHFLSNKIIQVKKMASHKQLILVA
jgi:hypothetical protein